MKERITITLDKAMVLTLDRFVADKTFGNRSHALAYLIKEQITHEKNK